MESKVVKLDVDKLAPVPVDLNKVNVVVKKNLATTSILIAVENEIPNVSNLVKEIYYNTKIREIKNKITTDHDLDKYTTTQTFIKLILKNYTARLKSTTLTSKNDIAKFVIKTNFDEKLKTINSNKKWIKWTIKKD